MYSTGKKLLSKIVSRNWLIKNEEVFRGIYSVIYKGNKHQCTVCNKKLSTFILLSGNDLLCPNCGSLSRDRRLWQLEQQYLKPGISMLDFSPSRCLARRLLKRNDINYLSTDLSDNFIARHRFDITNINLADSSVDFITCYHILEHIEHDSKAMAELYRVLKPGGTALIQTPYKKGDIYEDFTITEPAEREIHFGQDDHVRIYSVEGLKGRLEIAGFTVTVNTFKEDLYAGLSADETVLILSKQ